MVSIASNFKLYLQDIEWLILYLASMMGFLRKAKRKKKKTENVRGETELVIMVSNRAAIRSILLEAKRIALTSFH